MVRVARDTDGVVHSIWHVVAGLNPASGGPSRTVTRLADVVAEDSEIDVSLITQAKSGEPLVPSVNAAVKRYVGTSRMRASLAFGIPVGDALRQAALERPPSLIHVHGLWTATNHRATVFAGKLRVPLVIQPRGMLEPWALNYRKFKKVLALWAYQQRDLMSAAAFVATASEEAESIRRLGLEQPIAVIPNGIDMELATVGSGAYVKDKGRRVLLFLSRVHPVKGLLNLIRAWSLIDRSGWLLWIGGPNELGHLAEVRALAEALGVEESVRILGPVSDHVKGDVYRAADLFVLPTFSENFGVVVAEALTHGLPVITTRGAPWADLETYRCGWWINIGVEPLVLALRQAMSLTDNERRSMGMRGRNYVQRYDWDSIAQQTIAVYRWVLGQGSKPDCVYLG